MKATSGKAHDDREQLIRMIQNDYSHIRKELLNLSSSLRDKEIKLGKLMGAPLVNSDVIGEDRDSMSSKYSPAMYSIMDQDTSSLVSSVTQQAHLPSLEVHCLGKFRVLVGSKEIIHWRSLKAKSLLKYLLGNIDHSASKDMLMEALWPEYEPITANNNLKVAVLALRKTLEFDHRENGASQLVLFRDGNYIINPRIVLYVDAERFEYQCDAAIRLEREGRKDEAIVEYKSAASLYKGDFLEDNLYDDWALIKREALKDKYLTILCKLADHLMQKADYAGAVIYCEKVLEKDRCREDIYHRLMQCCSRLGQRNRAIEWYRLCEVTIKRELDTDPDPELAELRQKLVRGEHI